MIKKLVQIALITCALLNVPTFCSQVFAMCEDEWCYESDASDELHELAQAALDGNIHKVRELIKSQACIDQRDSLGNTALMYAVFKKHTKIAILLINARADVNLHNLDDETALTWAAKHTKKAGITRLLLAAKANPDHQDSGECTPLMHAAWQGRTSIVNLLLHAQANPTFQDSKGYSALMYAVLSKHGTVGLMQPLIQTLVASYKEYASSITEHATHFPIEICKLIAGFDNPLESINFQEKTACTLAIEQGKNQDLTLLLAAIEESAQ